MPAPRFEQGQTVSAVQRGTLVVAPPGPYRVLKALPADNYGQRSYRLTSAVDGHERVVPEANLIEAPDVGVPAQLGFRDTKPKQEPSGDLADLISKLIRGDER